MENLQNYPKRVLHNVNDINPYWTNWARHVFALSDLCVVAKAEATICNMRFLMNPRAYYERMSWSFDNDLRSLHSYYKNIRYEDSFIKIHCRNYHK